MRASGDFPSKGFEIQVNNAYARDQVKTGSLYHVVDINESPVKDEEPPWSIRTVAAAAS